MSHEDYISIPTPYLGICTVFKNQALYIREWIAFHHMLGVTKFFLYDQGSEEPGPSE